MKTNTLFSVFACALLAGCGGSSVNPSPAPAGSTDTTPGATEPAPAAETAPATPATPTKWGSVTVQTSEMLSTTSDFSLFANAYFGPKEAIAPEDRVEPTVGCAVLDLEEVSAEDAKQHASDSAGTLSVDIVLGKKPRSLELKFDPNAKQYDSVGLAADGPPSAGIRVKASGGAVPAFDVELSAVSRLQLLSPAPGAKLGTTDLKVTWTLDAGDAPVVVNLGTNTRDVRCYTAKASREVVIPAAMMTQLLASEGDVTLTALTLATEDIVAGDYDVAVTHMTSAHAALVRE